MVGGAALEDGSARFGRLAAKIPARRVTEALERLIRLYQAEGSEGETATHFFGRVDVARVKQTLADLEDMTPASATPQDYVDLGDASEFHVVTMEGECAS
jgi:sulfite reductase (NADPH) hemoprotein beta-component